MKWDELYPESRQPTWDQVGEYISNPYWDSFYPFIEKTFSVKPMVQYSKCSMERGWNIKYRKGSKAICTIYPKEGFFTCLVVVGAKAAPEAELILSGCDEYLQKLYESVNPFNGSRWLMIDITSQAIYQGAQTLLLNRVKHLS